MTFEIHFTSDSIISSGFMNYFRSVNFFLNPVFKKTANDKTEIVTSSR